MSETLVYLSFDIEHDKEAQAIFAAGLVEANPAFRVSYASTGLSDLGSDELRLLQDQIDRSAVLIVLVGEQCAANRRVVQEIHFAKRANVPYFGVLIGASDATTTLPADLPRNRTIGMDWTAIEAAVSQLLHEGKHHVFA